jgi:hypothetical protein
MNTKLATLVIIASALSNVIGSISDPVLDFKVGLTIANGDKLLKWQLDVNGDSYKEVFLCLKSDFDKEVEEKQPQPWDVYKGQNLAGGLFLKSIGVEEIPNTISGILPDIDVTRCFVGEITELGKNGILTIRHINPREGQTINIIYAYTFESDHLKQTELIRYEDSSTPHILFRKYLADDKRTIVIPGRFKMLANI